MQLSVVIYNFLFILQHFDAVVGHPSVKNPPQHSQT